MLSRRVMIGIRDWEFRLDSCAEVGDDGGDRFDPYILDAGGRLGMPWKSLLVRLCTSNGGSGMSFSALISSSVGAAPWYQAVGEDGDASPIWPQRSSGNIGFGLCMLPSDPLRRCGLGMP